MELELLKLKRDYLKNILNKGLMNDDYSSVIFQSSFALDEVKFLMDDLKDEYNINKIAYIDFDNSKVKDFFSSNPSEEEIDKFIPRYELDGKTKLIQFSNVSDYSDEYFSDYSIFYLKNFMRCNKELFRVREFKDVLISVYPNEDWAFSLFGNRGKLNELWEMVNDCLLSDDVREELNRRIEIKCMLNKMGINNLYFYTDFKISLNPSSIWCCNPDEVNKYIFNYPSYEIFTSSNCNSAEGKIVLSKKSGFYDGIILDNASFEFNNGEVVKCCCDSDRFNRMIFNSSNKLKKIGEIALVSVDSPLYKNGLFYNSVLLDENSGCHFALGNSIDYCIGMSDRDVRRKDMFDYYVSEYHCDFVFGNDSVCVEADTKDKNKVLIMENGKWKI